MEVEWQLKQLPLCDCIETQVAVLNRTLIQSIERSTVVKCLETVVVPADEKQKTYSPDVSSVILSTMLSSRNAE